MPGVNVATPLLDTTKAIISRSRRPRSITTSDVPTMVRARPEDLVPGGVDAPADVPAPIFEAAVSTFLTGRRFDIVAIASDHGLSRATLYRRVPGGREELLTEVIWFLTRRMFVRAVRAAQPRRGLRRVLHITRTFQGDIAAAPAFHRILETDCELALRIMTSWEGPVRPGLIAACEALILEEQRLGGLTTSLDAATLAYAAVRLGESFLYDAALAHTDPGIDQHLAIIERLFR